jgi:hypothetical protein
MSFALGLGLGMILGGLLGFMVRGWETANETEEEEDYQSIPRVSLGLNLRPRSSDDGAVGLPGPSRVRPPDPNGRRQPGTEPKA